MTSSHQVSRLLALVPYLQHHPDAELAAVASDFGVSPKQVVSDLEVLWYCGLPGGLPGDLIEIDMDAVRAEGRIRLSLRSLVSRESIDPVALSPASSRTACSATTRLVTSSSVNRIGRGR